MTTDVTYLRVRLVPQVPLLDTGGMDVLAAATPTVGPVSIYVAFVIGVLALFGGWFGHRLLTATQDLRAARNRLRGALRAVWAARRVALVVGFVIVIAADVWMRKHGG